MNFTTRLLKAIKLLVSHKVFPLFYILVFILASCAKPPGKIGAEIQPEQSQLEVYWFATDSVSAYSLPEDSIRTDEIAVNLLGSIMDPVFGSSVAGIYTQFKLSELKHDFGKTPVLDSLILQLMYVGDSYGDTITPLTVHAYEMTEGLNFLDEYYSNSSVPIDPVDYGNFQFIPQPHDSLHIIIDTTPMVLSPMLRINLSNENPALGYKFLHADSIYLQSDSAFTEFFKGLYVVTEPVSQGGSISYFNMLVGRENSSKMILYYHKTYPDEFPDSIGPSENFHFIINQFTPRFNRYEHDFTHASSEFRAQVINRDTTLGRQKFYTQGIAGVKSIVRLPNLRKTNALDVVAINEAKLVFTGFEADPLHGAPDQLALVEIQEDGSYLPLIDEAEGTNYFMGDYHSSTNSFTFRITRHMQALLNDTTKPNNGLYMFIRGESVKPQRFIFNGNLPESDTASPFRLEILYTRLK
jgi:hypothetical protein